MEKFPSFSWCIDRRKTLAKTGVASVEMRVTYMRKSKVMATWASAGGRDRQRAEGERQGRLASAVGSRTGALYLNLNRHWCSVEEPVAVSYYGRLQESCLKISSILVCNTTLSLCFAA